MLEKDVNNLPKEKFVLVNENKKLRDKELVTKPVGFFMDALHRFAKNKGSIVGAIVIGILVLYAIVAPIFSPYTVSYNDTKYSYMLPTLFDSEKIDFLDGSKNVDTNFITFVEHYSKGLETGHNAIKRQEFTYNENTEKYHYRLNSVRAVGTVFMKSITREDYYAIQRYQDESGTQIIYPITDVNKRPANKSKKNLNDANYWYETKPDPNSSNDIPVNYYFDEDGKLQLQNIYRKFTTPIMSSADSPKRAVRAILEEKDGGFAIKYIARAGTNFGGTKLTEDQFVGYIGIKHEEDETFVEWVSEQKDAATFVYDSTYNVVKTYIDGHKDNAEDGYYFFGIPNAQGSSVRLLPEANLASGDGIPFRFYNEGENEPVNTLELNKDYYFAGNRRKNNSKLYYAVNFYNSDLSVKTVGASTSKITFVETTGGYLLHVQFERAKNYVSVRASDNNNIIERTSLSDTTATVWTYDNTTGYLKTVVTGHTDPAYDKEYLLGFVYNEDSTSFNACVFPASEISDTKLPFKVISKENDSREPVNAIEAGKEYYLFARYGYDIDSFFYADGTFKGDNYFSKVRVEGEDNYLYDYAIQKDGDQFEIRVSYYDYYCYYHTQVKKDGITKPYFIFGTTALGQDLFTCLASGARFSFVLAIVVASVNLIVGAIYGAIEGYYGGKTDMIMERIVEILSAVPFMIVITLLKYHMVKSPHVLILFIAFFLTGWIGMSGLVRMQFYRFKNQEYVLAARTLGARDWRIMFKHIFPNALGTIVTSCVLVIPGMIFSETSLSYLGIINLNTGDMTSVGTLLANAQGDIDKFPHTILFPAIFISLLMLCFNLFGNGLRDAFNPSLRGTED